MDTDLGYLEKLPSILTFNHNGRSSSTSSPCSLEPINFSSRMGFTNVVFEQNMKKMVAHASFDGTQEEKKCWTDSEEQLLLELHNQYGNKWTSIAAKIEERDHNSVKNHFYAEIRKSLRRLNFFIKTYLHGKFKQININHVSKMITVLSEKYEHNNLPSELTEEIFKLKKYLFEMGKKHEQEVLKTNEISIMNENLILINELLDRVKKQNNCRTKIPNKMKSVEFEPECKQTHSLATSTEIESSSSTTIPNNNMYLLYFYPNNWCNLGFGYEGNQMEWMEVNGRS